MGRTKVLEFELGDIVECTKYDKRTMLIVEKNIRPSVDFGELYLYSYVGLDILDGEEYYIYNNINNKHYKIVG